MAVFKRWPRSATGRPEHQRTGAPPGRFHTTPGLLIGLACLCAVTLIVVMGEDAYYGRLWQTILMTVTFAVSWNLIGGLAGQHSFAHPILFGIGAYAGARLLISNPEVPMPVALLVGAIAATACAFFLTPAFRARGPYFAILTIAGAEGLRVGANAFFPGGSAGLYIPIEASPSVNSALWYGTIIAGVAILIHFIMDQSPVGSALRLIAEDEDAARGIGVPSTRLKVIAFVAGAPTLGAFGVLFAASATFLDPDTVFSLNFAVVAVLSALLGGIGLLWGAVTGAVVWELLSDQLRGSMDDPGLTLMMNGLILTLVIIFLPRGIFGTLSRVVGGRWRVRSAAVTPWLKESAR